MMTFKETNVFKDANGKLLSTTEITNKLVELGCPKKQELFDLVEIAYESRWRAMETHAQISCLAYLPFMFASGIAVLYLVSKQIFVL